MQKLLTYGLTIKILQRYVILYINNNKVLIQSVYNGINAKIRQQKGINNFNLQII